MTLTSFRLKVGNAMHDDMMKEQGFVVDLDVSGEQAAEILHIPEWNRGDDSATVILSVKLYPDS